MDISNTDSEIEVEFTYSVVWKEEDTPFSARMDKLAGGGFLPETFEVGRYIYIFSLPCIFPRKSKTEKSVREVGWITFAIFFLLFVALSVRFTGSPSSTLSCWW